MKELIFILFILLLCQVAQAQTGKNSVVCQEKKATIEGLEEHETLKICTFGNYQTKTKGLPDDKGRYSYQYELLKNGKPIKNQEMFNEKQTELINKINTQIKVEFQKMKIVDADCFEDVEWNTLSINDIGIEFTQEKILFNYSLGLSGACFSLDGVSIFWAWNEVEKYIAK